MRTRLMRTALTLVAACALGACAPDPVEHSIAANTPSVDLERHHHETTEAHGKAAEVCDAPVEGAFPCAGQGIPDEAKLVSSVGQVAYMKGDIATIMLPSEHIGCEVVHERLTCLVTTWPDDIDPNRDVRVPGATSINLDADGPTHMEAKADAPFWGGGIEGVPRGQVLPYGTVWFYKDFVFASEPNGLTFWNVNSHHGALINGDGYWPF